MYLQSYEIMHVTLHAFLLKSEKFINISVFDTSLTRILVFGLTLLQLLFSLSNKVYYYLYYMTIVTFKF